MLLDQLQWIGSTMKAHLLVIEASRTVTVLRRKIRFSSQNDLIVYVHFR